jgi:hypothetical protein
VWFGASPEAWVGLITSIINFAGGVVLAICGQIRHAKHERRLKKLETGE